MLTSTQITILRVDILADSAFASVPRTSDGDETIADAYNAIVAPDYWVWRTRVTQSEIVGDISVDATSWSWTLFINRSQGERDGWREMFADTGAVNASRANVRQGFIDIFSGASGAAQRTHLLAMGRRKATRGEKLFAAGAGSTLAPSTLSFEGLISGSDVSQARAN